MDLGIYIHEGVKLNPITLAFSREQGELEFLYSDYYFQKNLTHFRFCHIIALLFYLSASIIDHTLFPSLFMLFFQIRCAVVTACFVFGLIITYMPVYRNIWRQLSFVYILITGFGFLVMMVMAPAPDSYNYYIGIIVCMIFGYTFIREPFLWAGAAGCALLALYFVVAAALKMPRQPMLIYGFYLLVVNALGMLSSYAFEIRYRKDFLLEHLLNLEKAKVKEMADGLEKKVQSRTLDLVRSNEALNREINDRKTIEQALRLSQQQYRSLQSNIPIGLFRIVKGKMIAANPAMVKIFKAHDKTDLLARPVEAYFHKQTDIKNLREELREKDSITNAQVRLNMADGTPFWGLVNVTRSFSNDEASYYYDGTVEDITARKAMEQEKEKLAQQLRQAHKMESLGTLAGGIAHDFNNILTIALGFTEMALDNTDKESRLAQYLSEIKNAGERAKELVKQILTFARQAGEERLPIHVGKIAQETMRFLRSTIPATITINSHIESEAHMLGNATQIHQILMNLCTNAAHAVEDATGVIDVHIRDVCQNRRRQRPDESSSSGASIQIRVSDNGKGISPELLESIFDPYFTTKGPGEGTGMGLAVVHGIVESYGGRIGVYSKPYTGTTFTVDLPADTEPQKSASSEPEVIPTGNEHILFVDDEVSIATMGDQMLQRLGYRVETRTNSLEALELFRSKPRNFDLVITDMTMPGLTGDKLAAEIIKIRADIPIILCTGFSKKISEEHARSIGIQAITHKPFLLADLANNVRKVLDAAETAVDGNQ